jgi:hypothetical protein
MRWHPYQLRAEGGVRKIQPQLRSESIVRCRLHFTLALRAGFTGPCAGASAAAIWASVECRVMPIGAFGQRVRGWSNKIVSISPRNGLCSGKHPPSSQCSVRARIGARDLHPIRNSTARR